MSNVKAGDLAIIVAPARRNLGRIVEVLWEVPYGEFRRADGLVSFNPEPGLCWEYKYLGGPGAVLFESGGRGTADFGFGPDYVLRPLPGDTETEDTDTRVGETA